MHNFSTITEQAEVIFEARTKARDQALMQARALTRLSAHTIRAIHRSETEQAHALLNDARAIVESLKIDLAVYPDLYFAGYTQDAIKEFAEASTTCALIENAELPLPQDLGIEISTYINGLAEAIGELRRRCLDILRQGYSRRG